MTKKTLTVDDLLLLESIGRTALSPDGRFLAFVVQRPKMAAKTHLMHYLLENHRADIFLASMETGEWRKLTDGAKDDVGYWHPLWSPDSSRLAMLSTKGENVTLWVWEHSSDQLKQLTTCGIYVHGLDIPVIWSSDNTIVCSVLPEGERPAPMDIEVRSPKIAMREWPKAWGGEKATASVLESPSVPISERPQGQLLSINVETAEQYIVATGNIRYLRSSPTQTYFTFHRQVEPLTPRPGVPLRRVVRAPEGYTLGISSTAGKVVMDCQSQIRHVTTDSIRWSNNSRELAFIAHQPNCDQLVVFRIRPKDGMVNTVQHELLEPIAVAWSPGNHLLVLAQAKQTQEDEKRNPVDWWLIEEGIYARNVTKDMAAVPRKLLGHQRSQSLIGLASGSLWKIQPETASTNRVGYIAENVSSLPKIESIVWTSFNQGADELIVKCGEDDSPGWYLLRLSADGDVAEMHLIEVSGSGRTFVSASSTTRGIVFRSNAFDTTGQSLWLSRLSRGEASAKIFQINTFLKDIAHGELRKIEYESQIDGQPLKGWVILPVDYEEGKRYPLVTWVYAGRVLKDRPPSVASMYNYPALNRQLLASKGFAVLLPSMPLAPKGQVDDPLPKLVNGVLPAIDQLIETGIVDANRLAVIGNSFGGYSVFGLITQTNRFHAAVSLAGMSNLTSHYGTFDARRRYDTFPHEHSSAPFLAETGQTRMGQPPWQDPDRYIRNSPLFHVERVTTPVMIIQGDLDFVDIRQGEEFFTALYRENKKARFVRYWGEAHTIQSPANIRDMWERIFDWFDSCFASSESSN